MRRKKSTQSHTKDSNGAESGEGDDDDEDEEEAKTAEKVEAEQDVDESEQMEVENKENDPTLTEEPVHNHNGHVSSAEGECTDSSMDGIRNGTSSPGILDGESGNNGEVQSVEHTSDKRVEPSAEEGAGMGESSYLRVMLS